MELFLSCWRRNCCLLDKAFDWDSRWVSLPELAFGHYLEIMGSGSSANPNNCPQRLEKRRTLPDATHPAQATELRVAPALA
ncbi:hypothetical protein Y1Q_0012271 [Alligator mississippiensis]|uniref:Uncharacterized protein n=1 Tax=Alligator mississippiensis TaxID=8496 RepID=A0A151MN07_ALLMI|nr:hypothetical protein Y1Q_0012271 [Alligator mississippiensis]